MDWEETYHRFNPMEPLRSDDPRLYPNLFGDFLDTVATRISLNRDKNQKLLLSGHVGCGKSTFLNLLQERDEIKNNFFPVKYSIRDVLDPNDTDHIDLLLSLTLQTFITAQGSGVRIDDKLTDKLRELANELQGLIEREKVTTRTRRRETGAGVDAGAGLSNPILWFKTNFFVRYQIENDTRESVRTYYKPRMTNFLGTVDDLLTRIRASLNKSLLILVDDTDKIPPERALEIFLNNGQHLAKPSANIVFMVDTSISCSSKYGVIRAILGEEEFFPAIKVTERDRSISSSATDANRKMLRELALKRMDMELIEGKALEKAVEMSGGVVRELVRILREAIFKARGKVREDHVDQAVINIRNSHNLYGNHTKILKSVLSDPNWFQTAQENMAELEPTLLDLLHMPALFQYRNGEDKWYRPYPIFIPLLERL